MEIETEGCCLIGLGTESTDQFKMANECAPRAHFTDASNGSLIIGYYRWSGTGRAACGIQRVLLDFYIKKTPRRKALGALGTADLWGSTT